MKKEDAGFQITIAPRGETFDVQFRAFGRETFHDVYTSELFSILREHLDGYFDRIANMRLEGKL